jgi:hypothetical protein
MERICEYRNCNKDISDKRPQSKFCNRKCKGNEGKYKRRRKAFIEECIKRETKVVESIKLFKKLLEGKDNN